MSIELIYDRDCPNVAEARARLLEALARTGREASWTEWDRSSAESPEHARRFGSPTILVNGRDVAGEPARDDGPSCRLYGDAAGALQGVPAVETIAAALEPGGEERPALAARGVSSGWKSSLATVPGIAFAFLPKLACPACWPAYAGLLGSLGLGFLLQAEYLFPLTALFLVLAVGALALGARKRRGYRPLLVGVAASGVVLFGKFHFDSDPAMYAGIGMLVAACLWNAWPPARRDPGRSGCRECAESSPSQALTKEVSS